MSLATQNYGPTTAFIEASLLFEDYQKSKPPGGPVKPWLKKHGAARRWCIGQIDGEYLAKMEDVLSIYSQPVIPGRARLCFDERPCQLLDDVVAPLLVKPGKAAKEDNEYIRQGTAVVLLAYDLDSGIRYTQTRKQRTKADYAQFMDFIVTTYYADVEYIDLVQDNLNTHKYGSFYEHLPVVQARSLSGKLVFHFTPKHGSWLNIAEPGGRSH